MTTVPELLRLLSESGTEIPEGAEILGACVDEQSRTAFVKLRRHGKSQGPVEVHAVWLNQAEDGNGLRPASAVLTKAEIDTWLKDGGRMFVRAKGDFVWSDR